VDATLDVGGQVRRLPTFPRVEDLPLAGRATVAASAGFDVGLRTAASTAVAATMVRTLLHPGRLRREVRGLGLYDELYEAGDREHVYPAHAAPPDVRVVSREPMRWRWLPGTLDLLSAASPYVPVNPAVRAAYGSYAPNRTAWAQHWRHDDGARPTVLVVHGFMASPYWVNRVFFSLPWWYANGYDLLLVTLPFHGRRARVGELGGAGLFSNGPGHLVEGLLHAISDLRLWIDHLEDSGVEQVGVTGVSLGGYLTALLAAVEPRLHFAIPNVPVVDLGGAMRDWVPAGALAQRLFARHGSGHEQLASALRLASPLHHEVLLERERLFVVAGLGDRLAPPDHAERLWEHWGRPRIHAFPGNHVLHVERGAYLRRIGRFIRSTGFGV